MSGSVGASDWRILSESPHARVTGVHESLLQESEKDVLWYRDNFLGKAHKNYLASDSPRGPLAISLIKDETSYKALIRSNIGTERLSIPVNKIKSGTLRKIFGLDPVMENVISAMGVSVPKKTLKPSKNPNLPNELLSMEERQVIRSYKFGVEYAAPGQTTEEQALANTYESTSLEFKKFMAFLGETIDLSGWRGYRAGLDVSGANNTGIQSVYTKWQGYEIMYHVAPLLPHRPDDKQQLERKRHIGNDIVIIVFQDGKDTFDLCSIASHQNHVVALVTPEGEGYRIQISAKNGVPAFTPDIPDPPLLLTDAVSRDFFLHKCKSFTCESFSPHFQPA
ncbi:hypothetical protein BSLG_004906 [Batrachochytrium salamandrivorans]|nr:hypothetical protein BSLG_004906 [Batrachochytrium salamandrivorans]